MATPEEDAVATDARATLRRVETTAHVFSVGHSNHTFEHFAHLLAVHRVEVVVDVRSRPHSRFAVQFNGPTLAKSLAKLGVRYVSMGRELGGRPSGDEFYDSEGRVRYDVLQQSADFCRGIERLLRGAQSYRVAVMCSEEDPADCHRWRLIGRVLAGRGIPMLHIRGDGRLETDDQVEQADFQRRSARYQMGLFDDSGPYERSTRPVPPIRHRERLPGAG